MVDVVFHDFTGGLISGSASVLVGHPFDTVKSQGFFRGLSWPLVSAGVGSSVFFGVYSQILKVLGTTIDKAHDHPDYLKVAIASGVAGLVMPIIACPIEVIKIVLQSQIPHGVHKGIKFYRGPLDGVKDIMRRQGMKGMYRGFITLSTLNVIGSTLYMTSFEFMSYEGSRQFTIIPQTILNFFAGGVSGVCYWLSILPLDIIKSRLQADVERKIYRNIFDCAAKIYQEDGIKTFYRGAGVICVRGFIMNAVMLMVYSEYMKFFDVKYLP